jgi:hypothetical protein
MYRVICKFALILTLSTCIVSMSLAADITPDPMTPIPGPGKITSTGNWSVVKDKEDPSYVRLVAFPKGGAGGVAGVKKSPLLNGVNGTYSLTVENLTPGVAYDVVVIFEYTKAGKTYAVASPTKSTVPTN